MNKPAEADFAARYGRWAIVVGASEGVGAAVELAARGLNLLLLARNGLLLDQHAADLRVRYGVEVRTTTIDLNEPVAAARILDAAAGLEVGLLCYTPAQPAAWVRFSTSPSTRQADDPAQLHSSD